MNRNIIFDMDGVIFDTEQLYLACWDDLSKEYNIPGIREVALQCIGANDEMTKQIVMDHYGDSFPYDKYCKMISEYFQLHIRQQGMPVKPGVFELLEYLKKKEYRIGLATSTKRVRVEEQLSMTGLREYFAVLVCGDMVTKSKPYPEIFVKCARELNVKPEETYVIEDSFNGIRAAYRGGMLPIMVPDLLLPTDEIKRLCCQIFTNLIEVKEWLSAQE